MNPDADAAAAGCDAPQEKPQAAPLPRIDVELPDWLLAYGDKAKGWRMVKVTRGKQSYGCSYLICYYSPAGVAFRSSRRTVEEYIKRGGDDASRRLTATVAAAKGRQRGGAKKRGRGDVTAAASSDDDDDDDAADDGGAVAPKRQRGRSAIQELAVIQKEKERANRELAAKERRIQAENAKLAAEKAAFARQREAAERRRDAEARRSARHAPAGEGARPTTARAAGGRMCRCQRTAAECAGQLTVACDECGCQFHAECLGLAHDVAARMATFACADHADAAVEGRKSAAALAPHPRAARRGAGAGAADPAPSPSGSLFEHFPGAGGAAEDDAGSGSALPANWPRSAGSPAFLTFNVHGAWPTPEAWALLHATHDQAPLAGVQIRTLPLTHKLAKAAIGAKGSKPRGLFAARGFPQGAVVGDYVGHVRHATSMDNAAQYVFELSSVATPDGRKVLIDAGPCGNETRFSACPPAPIARVRVLTSALLPAVNWHRGLASAPNCKFEEARVLRSGGSCAELVVRVVTTRRILRDEELLIDYGGLYLLPGDAAAEGLLGDDDDDA